MSRWNIPQGWEWVRAGEIAEIVGGGTPPSSDPSNFAANGIPWLTPADLSGYSEEYAFRGNRDLSQAGLERGSARLLPPGAVLFTSRAPIGYCVIAANKIATNQGFKSLVLKDGIEPRYVRHYLLSSREYAESLASGSTFKELSGTRMAELEIPVPPKNEQLRIVAVIEELQERSRRTREALATIPLLVDKFRKSVLAAAFHGDLTADWRERNPDVEPASVLLERLRAERRQRWEAAELAKMRVKGKEPKDDRWKQRYEEPESVDASELPELPEGWCWAGLEELAIRITDGTHQPPPFSEAGIPFLVIRNVVSGSIDWDSVSKWVSRNVFEEFTANCRPERGDVLYTAVGTYGIAVEVCFDRDFMFQRHIAHIKPVRPSDDAGYLATVLNSPVVRDQAEQVARGAAQKTVTLGSLRRFAIPLAPEQEQRIILRMINRAFGRVVRLDAIWLELISACEQMDRSILNKAFRGELVPQDPSDEPASVLLERIRAEHDQEGPRRGRGRRPARPTAP